MVFHTGFLMNSKKRSKSNRQILDHKLLWQPGVIHTTWFESHEKEILQSWQPCWKSVLPLTYWHKPSCFEKSNWNKVYLSHEIIYQIKEIHFDYEFVIFWRRNRIFHRQRNKSWKNSLVIGWQLWGYRHNGIKLAILAWWKLCLKKISRAMQGACQGWD